MDRYQDVYTHRADDYDRLVSREDHEGNLLRAIEALRDPRGCEIAELGAGTGRLTVLVAPKARRVRAFDAYPAMLEVARRKLQGFPHVTFATAENKALPLEAGGCDLSLAGWTFGHCTSWFPETWRDEIDAAVGELLRVLKPGGTAIILETLGTGSAQPAPPNERLAAYYAFLEEELGFARSWIRTDYRFPSLEEARALTRGFFGKDYEFTTEPSGAALLPECTGLWHRTR